ncbi:N-acetylglucosamine kinase [Arthrobacter dokdonensis]|uniref:N-acetylglucosamine kinase n=1 Tax=Arthrobacter dokdonellae TaxID=2211210 RepID=UPI000DE5BA06|nr:BadF/BadG/BcrA/BcrD ATPase family protein [Arthrobacter dokdonellae]
MVTMNKYLAVDAGGTSTRAVLVSSSGACLGYGFSGGGNPVSRGFEASAAAVLEAAEKALSVAGGPVHSATIAQAGASLQLPSRMLLEGFRRLGVMNDTVTESDLLAVFYSGTYQNDGHALIAGTGAVAARVQAGRLAAVADGAGWLLGDSGAGFWLGREVVRAVAAALDGRGPRTTLTEPLLAELDIHRDTAVGSYGRTGVLQQLINETYELAPIELSRFAPLVFDAPGDPVAVDIANRAAAALARTLLAVMEGHPGGPLVFGGSVLVKGGTVAGAVLKKVGLRVPAACPAPVLVHDGVVGAAVLALKRHGVEVDAGVFGRIATSLAALRG